MPHSLDQTESFNGESTRSSVSLETQMWKRQARAILVECESGTALFYHLGQKFFVEAPGLETYFPILWNFLEVPRSNAELKGMLPTSVSFDVVLKNLIELRLVSVISNKIEPQPAPESVSVQELGQFLEWLEAHKTLPSKWPANLTEKSHQVSRDVLTRAIRFWSFDGGRPELKMSLLNHGFENVEQGRPSDLNGEVENAPFFILWGQWGKLSELRRVHRELIRTGKEWFLVLEDEFGGSLGPSYAGPGSPCLECLILRRQSSIRDAGLCEKIENYTEQHPENLSHDYGPWRRRLADLAAFEVIKILGAPVFPKTRRGLFEFDFLNHHSRFQEVLPVPHCKSCGTLRSSPPMSRGTP